MVKNGTRLQSQVCDTEIIVVRVGTVSGTGVGDVCCGGSPMVALGEPRSGGEVDPDFAEGTAMGKRYVDAGGSEVLVTKAGKGTLCVDGAPLRMKEAKPLPASD